MKSSYSYIVVEDEPIQVEELCTNLEQRLDLNRLEVFYSVHDAYDYLVNPASKKPDILFLDIKMNLCPEEEFRSSNLRIDEIDGYGLLKSIEHLNLKIRTIIISAHRDEAVHGYSYDVTGFIPKPIDYDMLDVTIQKAVQEIKVQNSNLEFKVAQKKTVLLKSEDILYFEGTKEGKVHIFTIFDTYESRGSLKNLESDILPQKQFVRIHDSYIVNRNKILEYESSQIHLYSTQQTSKIRIPIGRKYRDRLNL